MELRRPRTYPWRIIGPLIVYAVLVLAGVSQSSVGVQQMREDPSELHGTQWGVGQAIRSDEWRTSTPFQLGVMASGTTEDLNPLAAPQAFLTGLPSGPISSIVLIDATAFKIGWLPDASLFAARWWLPFLLLALGAPAFFRNLTGNRYIGWFAAALIALSPASAWWSFSPLQVMAIALAGAASLQNATRRAVERRYLLASAWSVASAVILTRSLITYQPWAVVLVGSVLAATVAAIVLPPGPKKARGLVVALTGVGTVGLVALVLGENREALEAVTNTIYPGDRAASGMVNPFQLLFGATALSDLDEASALQGTNQSEISSSFTVAFVWTLILLTQKLRFHSSSQRIATITLAVASVLWAAWAMVNWDQWSTRLPLINQVTSGRAADVLGFLAIVLLCLILPACGPGSRKIAGLAAVPATLVAASAGSLLQTANLAPFSIKSVWVSSLLLGLVVYCITRAPHRVYPYISAGLLALALVWHVNPVLFGLGDLRGTTAANLMLTAGRDAREHDTVWASDNGDVDSLMIATGVPALSGRQVAGPDRDNWARLVPDPAKEEIWNRGAAFIYFRWSDQPGVHIEAPGADVITVDASPCVVRERLPQLKHIVSSTPLNLECGEKTGEFMWSGSPRLVYTLH